MKKKVKIIIGVSVLCLVLLAGIWYLLKPTEVEGEDIMSGDLMQTFTVTGHVVPKKSTYISAPLSGRIEEIYVQEGEAVTKGDMVIRVDDSEERQNLERQIASLELQKTGLLKQGSAARAEISVTRQQLENQLSSLRLEYEQLYGENGDAEALLAIARENFTSANISYWRAYDKYADSHDPSSRAQLSSLEAARASAEQALLEAENRQSESAIANYESQIASLESQLKLLAGSTGSMAESSQAYADQLDLQIEQMQEQLHKITPEAPFSGIVWEILVQDGDYVAAGQALYRIYEPEEMEVEANLLDSQAALLKIGGKASIELVNGTVLDGEVSFISPISTEELSVLGVRENRCRVFMKVDQMPDQIGAGHQVSAEFSMAVRENVIHIPMSALISCTDGYGVCVVEKGKAVFCPVETGAQSGGRVEIIDGLSEGMTIVTNPYDAGVDGGERVRIKKQ